MGAVHLAQPVSGQLLDRDEELDAIRAALALARAGEGRLLLIEGAPGTGKTTLMRRARAMATGELTVLSARGSPVETSFPFGVVRQLLAGPVLAAGGDALTTGPAVHARRVLLEPSETDAEGEQPGPALLHALFWVVAGLADRGPLLIAVDDAHWADAASVGFLRFLLSRLEDVPVALVLATRPPAADRAAGASALAALELDPLVTVLRPAELGTDAVRRLATEALGEPDDAFVAACLQATGGNPFFLNELLRALAAAGTPPTAAAAGDVDAVGPARVARWVLARLGDLPPEAARLARAVAVLGDDAPVRLAAALAGLGPDRAAEIAALLVRAAILDDARPLRFAHPIVRTAIYQDMPEPERAGAHGRAGRLLATDPARQDEAAAHHLRSEPRGDADVAALLEAAAQRALARGAADAADVFLQRALEEPPPPNRRPRVLVALGRARMHLGRHAAAEEPLREAHDTALDDGERADACRELARSAVYQGRFEAAHALLEAELERTHTEEAALVLETERLQLTTSTADLDRTRARLERYAELPGSTRTERALLAYLGLYRMLDGAHDAGIATIRRALGDGRLFGPDGLPVVAWFAACTALMALDDLGGAGPLVERALADARQHNAPFEYASAAAIACGFHLRTGELADAEAHARSGLDALGDAPWRVGLDARLAAVLVLRGAFEEADRLLDRCVPGDRRDFAVLTALLARGLLRTAQGRTGEAVESLEAALALERRLGYRHGGYSSGRHLLVLALAGHDRDRALALAHEDLAITRAQPWQANLGVSLWCLGVAEGGAAGIAHLREGVAHLERTRLRLVHARALTDLGAALRRAGARQEAREPLRAALEIATTCGAEPLRARAADELRATGARPRRAILSGAESLTPMERRIAQMAAEGLSNPQIAQALFVTRKNVEMHLSRAYGKLAIRSRAELPAALGAAHS